MENLQEMDKFLGMYIFPRLNQDEIQNISRTVTSNEIESVIKKLPTNRSPGEFYQTFKELTPVILKLFQKIVEEGTF